MKILAVKSLVIPDVKVIKYARFCDQRGYFTEHFRRSDLQTHPALSFLQHMEFLQTNESYSRQGTIRGLHFQWNPLMGKLVRPLSGRLVDMALDKDKNACSVTQWQQHPDSENFIYGQL